MKKRLEDYVKQLEKVRKEFSSFGEDYVNRLSNPSERKALEIILMNKVYIPSEEDDED